MSDPKQPKLALSVKGLNAWYGKAHILFDIDLSLPQGQVVALLGRNGAGKSTTIKSIMGLMARKRGKILLRDQDISAMEPFQIARLGLGFVPEDRRIFTDLTVIENLKVGQQAERAGAPQWAVEDMFDLFPNLKEMPHRLASQMSGGEQQMLTVARTLMGNPHTILLDEPSEGVAPIIVEQMGHMILKLKQQGLSVLLSEQNTHFARWVSDQAYVLEKGQVVYSGPISQMPE
jgi:branched-chain amino acid transport system ATP-binding protein